MRQKDLDARWTKKQGSAIPATTIECLLTLNTESSENMIWGLTNVNDSQLLPALLNPDNQGDVVWAYSPFVGIKFEELLESGGFESNIHVKRSRNDSLDDATNERNKIRSTIRAKVEHAFGGVVTWMKGKLTLRIGHPRTKASWYLRNLIFNFIRHT